MNKDQFFQIEKAANELIIIRKVYCRMIGDLNAGIMLSHIAWWHLPGGDGNTKLKVERKGLMWFVHTADEWQESVWLTAKQQRRCNTLLKQSGFVEIKRYQDKFESRKNHYRIIWENFLPAYEKAVLGAHGNLPKGVMDAPKGTHAMRPKVSSLNKNLKEDKVKDKKKDLPTTPKQPVQENDHPKPAKERKPNHAWLMGEAIAEVTLDNIELNKGKILANAKRLVKAGYTPEQVRSVYEKGGLYWRLDWRAKNNQAPDISAINATIAKYAGMSKKSEPEVSAEELIRQRDAWKESQR